MAPESLMPRMRDAWFFSSLRTKQPADRNVGMLSAFVAKPIPNVMASSVPRNSAVSFSNSTCKSQVPYCCLVAPVDTPYLYNDSIANSAHGPFGSAKPR